MCKVVARNLLFFACTYDILYALSRLYSDCSASLPDGVKGLAATSAQRAGDGSSELVVGLFALKEFLNRRFIEVLPQEVNRGLVSFFRCLVSLWQRDHYSG